MTTGNCKRCGKKITRRGSRPPVFCSLQCKSAWEKSQKPIGCEDLRKLYVVQGLSTYAIAKRVHRDPKRVYQWLLGCGIQPRPRGWSTVAGAHPFHAKRWLEREYRDNQRSAAEIASECGVTENNILYFLRQHGIETRGVEETRAIKYWGLSGPANPMYGKSGGDNPNWKGGVTPQRQATYLSPQWKAAVSATWRRHRATCARCGLETGPGVDLHVHHLVTFACEQLRVDPDNLVLLCSPCHRWVHSRHNTGGEWIALPLPHLSQASPPGDERQ